MTKKVLDRRVGNREKREPKYASFQAERSLEWVKKILSQSHIEQKFANQERKFPPRHINH